MKHKFLFEKLQTIYEYDNDFFTYDKLEKDLWFEKIKEARDKFKIYFDLENDYPVKSQRVITIPQTEWEHTDCKFKCEMYSAGGDWEIPVRYFRIQITDGYCFNDNPIKPGNNYIHRSSYSNSHFIFIPGKKEGNYHLVPFDKHGERKWTAPDNNQYYKDIDPKANERDCWDSVEKYLKEMVDKEIEQLRKERENDVSSSEGGEPEPSQ
jgi:hypothetical protein